MNPLRVLTCCFALLAPGLTGAQELPPILFVTQPPFGADFTTVNATFGNHLGHTGVAPRGGDLYIRYGDGTLRNLTAEAGYGGAGEEIAVREPSVHWSGERALFSMVIGGTTQNDYSPVYWQVYEVTGFLRGEEVQITRLPQPEDFNNVSPLYGTDGRILFTSDRPRNGDRLLYPQLDEYESAPTVTGIWSMQPDGSDLKLLDHAVSGDFTPIISSDGRVIFTRWDHLQRDQQNDDGTQGYGAFNYASEHDDEERESNEEVFPEPRTALPGSPLHGHRFNFFFPWQMNEDGTGLETLNHVGRHELASYFNSARDGLPEHIAGDRRTSDLLLHLEEDPGRPGYFYATACPEFGTHAAGQIVGIDGALGVNADDMEIDYVTDPVGRNPIGDGDDPNGHPGLFRNPVPLTDGSLIAVYTSSPYADRRVNGALSSRYDFHLVRVDPGEPHASAGERLIPAGIHESISYFDNYSYSQHSYDGPLWELDPVEVRARPVPTPHADPLPAIERQILEEELGGPTGVEALRAFLEESELALVVSRNVTRRADRQQDFNLKIAHSDTQTAEAGATPREIAHLQFFQGDQIRGYSSFNTGRRPIAQPMHAAPLPELPGAPPGGVRLGDDGSMAAFVPARRALTWQLVAPDGEPVVRERYWVTFAAGEMRVCANCHGINRGDTVLDEPAPSNPPEALRELARWWETSFGSPGGHSIRGAIRSFGGDHPVAADVDLLGATPSSVTSDAGGDFMLADLASGDWEIVPRRTGGDDDAANAQDAAHLLEHLVGKRAFSSVQETACDVTANGSLSSLDAVRILEHAVGGLARFPAAVACDSDWVFMPEADPVAGQTVRAPLLAGGTCTPGGIGYAGLAADAAAQSFRAAPFGDCSGSWSPPGGGGAAREVATRPTRVRLGRPRRIGRGRYRVALVVRGTAALQSLQVEIASRGTALQLDRLRPARRLGSPLVASRVDGEVVRIALARVADDERPFRGRALWIEVSTETARRPRLHLQSARVNGTPAVLRRR